MQKRARKPPHQSSTTIMACTDSINDTLNALHATDDADQTTPIITLEYAAYMN